MAASLPAGCGVVAVGENTASPSALDLWYFSRCYSLTGGNFVEGCSKVAISGASCYEAQISYLFFCLSFVLKQATTQNLYIRGANEFFENVVEFKYLWTTATNQNYIHKEIKEQIKFGKCLLPCTSESLSSLLLSRNVKIKLYNTMILPFILRECESWCLTFRQVCTSRVGTKCWGNIWDVVKRIKRLQAWKESVRRSSLIVLFAEYH